jgi:mitotic-spindle organizing protein 1
MPPQESKRQAAREVIDILHEISVLLVCSLPVSQRNPNLGKQNTHLDRTELSLCVSLIENGVNPEALAVCIPSKLHCLFKGTTEERE